MSAFKQWVIYFFGKYLLKYVVATPSAHPKKMRLFSIFDLHVILGVGLSFWLRYLRTLRAFLKQQRSLDTWSSISDIYPRGLIILYYFLLFTWAKFNNILETVIASPQGCLLGELFIRYICEMDVQIDRVDGSAKLNRSPFFPKRSDRSQEFVGEFLAILQRLNISRSARQRLIREFQIYRQSYLTVSQLNAQRPKIDSSLEEVLVDKSKVAGQLWGTWAMILSLAYSLPEAQIRDSEKLLHDFGMVTQVFDDMADVPHDLEECQPNILYAICCQHPQELQLLDAHLREQGVRFLNLEWAKTNLPLSTSAAKDLAHQYLDRAIALDREGHVREDMTRCYAALSLI
jgi:hypothetical protein